MSAAEEFAECCAYQRWFVDNGWVTKQVAVDNLQLLSDCAGFVDELGVDLVQRLMSEAFAPAADLPSDYARQLVMQWELADPRDAWRWTGELPPAPSPELKKFATYKPAHSTIWAFEYVLSLGDQERLATWLRNHLDDAPTLVGMVEAA